MISVKESERGSRVKRRRNPAFAQRLEQGPDELLRLYADRILPINTTIARHWGQLSAELGRPGADLMLGSTAVKYGMQVATRKDRHVLPTGVALVNPVST
ncbi:PIN domain-containing protein [Synechococcus sp. HK05]|uniref:PIN domain-containing protein n=1 Tax=Synechococcus sp. HK05 TaxID=2725975 RepID=UPI0034CFD7A8